MRQERWVGSELSLFLLLLSRGLIDVQKLIIWYEERSRIKHGLFKEETDIRNELVSSIDWYEEWTDNDTAQAAVFQRPQRM